MALNLNTSPYYDDFSDDKRFHRVLFKPGVAVQARELTQLQTILQDQLDKGFGFVIQEGAVIVIEKKPEQPTPRRLAQGRSVSTERVVDVDLIRAYLFEPGGGRAGAHRNVRGEE